MIAGWMVYVVFVTSLVACAAWALERPLRTGGMATRGVWVGAALASLALAMGAWLLPGPGEAVGLLASARPTSGALPQLAPPQLAAPPALPALDPWLVALWSAATLTLAALLGRAALRLRRARRRWPVAELDGRTVLRSVGVGPAVVGVLRSSLVVPAWAFELPAPERELMLRHEEEHLRAGDTRLAAAGLALAVAMPWNPGLWWMVLRLRQALEIDCDRRVLSASSDVRPYARLLLAIVQRGAPLHAGALALVRPAPFLERRIRIMTTRKRWSPFRTAASIGAAAVLGFAACQVDRPMPAEPEAAEALRRDGVAAGPMAVDVRAEAGTLVGTVADRANGEPLASVQVLLPGLEQGALTNRQGRFVLFNVAPGEHELVVEHAELGRQSAGVVTVAEETPAQAAARAAQTERIRTLRELHAAQERLDASRAGDAAAPSRSRSDGGLPNPAGLGPDRGAITGTIVDERGEPVAAAHILLHGLDVGALSNVQGRFLIIGVPAGTHRLAVSGPGDLAGLELDVEVTAGTTAPAPRIVLRRR